MGFTLKVLFHGTVALVRSEGQEAVPMLLARFENMQGVNPQVPYVRFALKNWSSATRREPEAPPATAQADLKETHRHVVLDGELLHLDIPEGNETLEIIDGHNPAFDRPFGDDVTSVHWLPHIERINPGAEIIDPVLLQRTAGASARLAARVDVKQGRLETSGASGPQVTFSREDGTGESRHSIARDSVLTIQVPGDHFILRSEPLDDQISVRSGSENSEISDGSNDMRFEANGDAEVEIIIGNEPLDDIFASPEPLEITDEPAREFSLFYKLSSVPVPNPALPLGRSRGGNHQLCANAVFKPPTP
jgi:hypothetical protein